MDHVASEDASKYGKSFFIFLGEWLLKGDGEKHKTKEEIENKQ